MKWRKISQIILFLRPSQSNCATNTKGILSTIYLFLAKYVDTFALFYPESECGISNYIFSLFSLVVGLYFTTHHLLKMITARFYVSLTMKLDARGNHVNFMWYLQVCTYILHILEKKPTQTLGTTFEFHGHKMLYDVIFLSNFYGT